MSLALLQQVKCAEPFSVLGWQQLKADRRVGLILRVYLPDALAVSAVSAKTGKSLGELTANSLYSGVFELSLPKKRVTEPYILTVKSGSFEYQLFRPLISFTDAKHLRRAHMLVVSQKIYIANLARNSLALTQVGTS